MSQPYFTSNPDPNGTARVAGYPPIPPQQDREYGPMFGQEPPGVPADGGHRFPPGFPPPPPASGPGKPGGLSAPRRMIAVAGVLGALTLGLGGFAVVTHGDLADAQTKAEDLAGSLDKAKAALSDQKSELDTAQQAATEATATLEAVTECAAGLYDAWNKVFNNDIPGAKATLNSALPGCDKLFGQPGA
jgi:hypothetical protein